MNSKTHELINRLAKVFAFVIIISVISGIIKCVVGGVSGVVAHFNENNKSVTEITKPVDIPLGTTELELNLQAIDVNIKNGDEFAYSTNNGYIDVSTSEGKIYILERKHNLSKTEKTTIDIVLPVDAPFSEIKLDSGAGNINIESLYANRVDFDLGAGNVNIECMNVTTSVDIDAGAGNFNLEAGTINNCKFDCGVGNVVIGATMLGECKFDCGIGKLDIHSANPISEYTVTIDKGLGTVRVNGESCNDGQVIGNGLNTLKFSSGIGEVNVDFAD